MADGEPRPLGASDPATLPDDPEREGWTAVVSSRELPPGAVVAYDPVEGEPLVVWRGESGVLVAMDDRCPHQWSSLSAVGVVDGDEIVCTTHFWRFGASGDACKQSMGGRRDAKDPTSVVPCRDDGQRVWVRRVGAPAFE